MYIQQKMYNSARALAPQKKVGCRNGTETWKPNFFSFFSIYFLFLTVLPHISSPSLLQLYCLYFEHNLCDKWNDVIAKKNHYNSKSFFIFFPIPKMRDSFLYQLLKFYSAHNKLKISLNIQAQEQASSDKKIRGDLHWTRYAVSDSSMAMIIQRFT